MKITKRLRLNDWQEKTGVEYIQYNVHGGPHLLKPQVHKICMNGAHETVRNNRPGSFIKSLHTNVTVN